MKSTLAVVENVRRRAASVGTVTVPQSLLLRGSSPRGSMQVENIVVWPPPESERRRASFTVQEADGGFFENFTALQWKLENKRLQILRAEEEDAGQSPRASPRARQRHPVRPNSLVNLSQDLHRFLYIETLYTIRHKIGGTSGFHTAIAEDLYSYAQQAFDISNDEQQHFLKMKQLEKPPIVILNVIVLGGRSLIAKDANGFSDPFCMLGIVPGQPPPPNNFRDLSSGSPHDSGHDSESGMLSPTDRFKDRDKGGSSSSIRKRFGGSFRRKKEKAGDIPARLIKATSVQYATLNPEWNEKFKFDLLDIKTEQFHLDIWDHDDEESVIEAVKKLNEVKGVKGLGRYFKQVAQSARTDDDDSVDDFLGSVNLDLKDLPSTGIQKWFKLDGRSTKSRVQGEINLQLSLGTREDRGVGEEDLMHEIMQHESLISIFAEYELRKFGKDSLRWAGELPQAALTILHQHAIQGDIFEVQQALCHWLAFSKLAKAIPLDANLLHNSLDRMDRLWVPSSLSKDEEELVAESFSEFLNSAYDQIKNHREIFVAKSKSAQKRLHDLLRTLSLLHNSKLIRKCLPFQQDLKPELVTILKKSAYAHYEKCKSLAAGSDEDGADVESLSEMIMLTTSLNGACHKAVHYHPAFQQVVGINYFQLTYKEWQRLLVQESAVACLAQRISSDLTTAIKSGHKKEEQRLLQIFELNLAISEFMKFRERLDPEELAKSPMCDIEVWFDPALSRWLTLAKEKCQQRIDLALQMDKPIPLTADSEIKQSTSHVDVCYCFQQIIDFWTQLSLPNTAKRLEYIEKLIVDLAASAMHYIDRSFAVLINAGFYENAETTTNNQLDHLCTVVNNAEHVRKLIKDVPSVLQIDEIRKKLEKEKSQQEAKERIRKIVEPIEAVMKEISTQIENALRKLVDKRRDELKKHMFHLAWSPSACETSKAIQPLIKALDARLINYHRWLLHKNFSRMLILQFLVVLQEVRLSANENEDTDPNYYRKLDEALDILVEFYHAEGKGPSMEQIKNEQQYKETKILLRLNKGTTQELISEYYNLLMKDQENCTNTDFGILNVRAYFNSHSSRIAIDVVNAKDIIPLDSNGLSDPFVIIELVPTYFFEEEGKVVKTRVISKTLNPEFNENFHFDLPQKCNYSEAMIHFIVMDYDFLMANDFAGEAFLRLSDVPGLSNASLNMGHHNSHRHGQERNNTLKQFCLTLIHNEIPEPSPLTILAERKEDKLALEFLRHLDMIRKT